MFIDTVRDRISVAEPVTLVFKDLGKGGAIRLPDEPTLRIPREHGKEFFESMAKVADERGFPSPSEENVKGLLEATERHLEDMRTLVFRDKQGRTWTSKKRGGCGN
jgi:hypothetical protein